MARYAVRYQIIDRGKPSFGSRSIMVTANGVYEAKQVFKYNHIDTATQKYKIIAAVKVGP
jgi:hypothetical protein